MCLEDPGGDTKVETASLGGSTKDGRDVVR